ESHYVWGERCLLHVQIVSQPPQVERQHRRLVLSLREPRNEAYRRSVLDAWYRQELRREAEKLLAIWVPRLEVQPNRLFIQRMKTRWGSCNPSSRNIRLNTELAQKPLACLEYVLVHELLHLKVAKHNAAFFALMDAHLPSWRLRKQELNESPLAAQQW
ncbi:MAG: M48 family metallopeptidase, partial [Vampirovibrionales bacterium]